MTRIILQYLSVMGMSSVKVIPGLAMGMAFEMNFLELFVSLSLGGIAGTFLFTYLGERLRRWLAHYRHKRRQGKGQKPINVRRIRRILRIWHRFGLAGIAALTPPIISPPIGVAIALAFRENRGRIILYMSISVVVWAAIFALVGKHVLDLIT